MSWKKVVSAATGAAVFCTGLSFIGNAVNPIKSDVITANAEDETVQETENLKTVRTTGYLGEKISFEISDDGVMTVSGEGDMYNYSVSDVPFKNNVSIKSVIIGDGITSIGRNVFSK